MRTRPAFSLTVALAACLAPAAQASPQLAKQAGCVACHAVDKPMVGPSWQAIAARYRKQADAPAQLADKVRKGSANVWGKLPMAPTGPDKIGDADLKALVSWVLKTP